MRVPPAKVMLGWLRKAWPAGGGLVAIVTISIEPTLPILGVLLGMVIVLIIATAADLLPKIIYFRICQEIAHRGCRYIHSVDDAVDLLEAMPDSLPALISPNALAADWDEDGQDGGRLGPSALATGRQSATTR